MHGIVNKIREVGVSNVRLTTTNANKVIIEVFEHGIWKRAFREVDRNIAEDILRQATNKLILG
jgi:hypothetical protein